ncbi:hypothetical protein ACF0H5_006269 [Mactra antiquata]
MLLRAVLCAAVTVSITVAVPDYTGHTYDVCQKKNLQLDTVGKSGYILFDNTSMDHNHDYSCVLKIDSCSSCQIELKPVSQDNFDFYCPSGEVTSRYCSLGCDYLYIFDMNYMNETVRDYRSWQQFNRPFKSESSSVFILLCHGYSKNYSFKIAYNTTKKLKKVQGLSNSALSTGFISSPYFPSGYAQNHEVYEYQLNSSSPSDYVQLMFEDWHLSDTSVFYFENSNVRSPISGRSPRPVVISNKNYLRFTFHTGVSLTPGNDRDYLGFHAAYRFYNNRADIPLPQTDCKSDSYHMSSVGGKIEFTASSLSKEKYDCIWVVKKNDRFQGIFMKIIKFQSNEHFLDTSLDNNQLYIRDGLTSIDPIFQVVNMEDLLDSNDGVIHFSNKGFYLRLQATFSSSTTLIISYASYSNGPGCDSMLYVCDNRRCIDQSLVCDGVDHCGDNSDEVAGCGDSNSHWDKSYQYTITIGVIVPMVISVFLIMVICLLFVMIRRCRRAQLNEIAGSNERLRTVSEEVSEQHGGRRRRRRRRGLFSQIERDRPPTYDEAMQNPPGWYQNVAFGNPVDPSLPQPPSYHEAIGGQNTELPSTTNQPTTPGSPVSSDSSQSEITMCSGNISDTSTSTSEDDDNGERWGRYRGDGEGRRGRLGRHMSSSESDTFTTVDQSRLSISSPEHSEPVNTASVLTSQSVDNVDSPDIELGNINNGNRTGRDAKLHDKNILKIPTSESDDFVIPAGPKPGSSDIAGPNPSGSDIAGSNVQPDVIRRYDSPKTSVPKPAPRKSLDHRRNQPSECDTDQHNSDVNRSKPNRTNNSAAINPAFNRSEDSTDTYYDACNNNITNTDSSSEYHNTRDGSVSNLNITPAHSTSLHNIDDNLQSHTVVNVDDDDVIIMYDSQTSLHGASMTPPQYLLSQVQHINDNSSRANRTRERRNPAPSDERGKKPAPSDERGKKPAPSDERGKKPAPSGDDIVSARTNYGRSKPASSNERGERPAPTNDSRSYGISEGRGHSAPRGDNVRARTNYSRDKPAPSEGRGHSAPSGDNVRARTNYSRENPAPSEGRGHSANSGDNVRARTNYSRDKPAPSEGRGHSAPSGDNVRARTNYSRDNTRQSNDDIHIDETVMSANDEQPCTPRSIRGYSSRDQSLQLSLNNDLEDLEDVYV